MAHRHTPTLRRSASERGEVRRVRGRIRLRNGPAQSLARAPGAIAEECQKCEVELVFVTEPLDSSPEGQLLTFVRGWAAQLEREKIKGRTIRGKARTYRVRPAAPRYRPHWRPYGYRYETANGR